MATIRMGYGKSLDHYHSKEITSPNLDISIQLNRDVCIEVNVRPTGYAIRRRINPSKYETLADVDY